jgi:hypothetical protein
LQKEEITATTRLSWLATYYKSYVIHPIFGDCWKVAFGKAYSENLDRMTNAAIDSGIVILTAIWFSKQSFMKFTLNI